VTTLDNKISCFQSIYYKLSQQSSVHAGMNKLFLFLFAAEMLTTTMALPTAAPADASFCRKGCRICYYARLDAKKKCFNIRPGQTLPDDAGPLGTGFLTLDGST
jgi:hypothetical protein